MNEFRIRSTGQVVTEQEYRAMHDKVFPQVLVPEDADAILQAPAPAITTFQTAARNGVVQDALGNWVHAYVVTDWPQGQIDAHVAAGKQAQRVTLQAEIDALERSTLLNRGTREMQIFQLEERATQFATANGVPVAAVLATNIYYGKLKALDDQMAGMRVALAAI